ncbi:TMhelix containing protein [Vibrio phage 1.138.O._10N.261.48.A1]|nr:TMhelix containing protein [Vibrio phage 1.138.O._10N.261.48.A1]
MTEAESSLLLGLVAGFVLALIFTGMWFVHNLKEQEERGLEAVSKAHQSCDLKIEECMQAHEVISTNYMQFMEKKLQHTAVESYCKGLSQTRMIVKYLQQKDFMNADIACDAMLMKIGEKMKPAEEELEIRHKILKEHNHHV